MRVPVAGWSGFLISHSLWAGSRSCSAVPSLPREGDLGTCREPERVWSFPTSFACQCSPSCSSPSCPDELLRNSSLFIRIKPKSCPSRGHPSELPAPPGHQLDTGSSCKGAALEQPSPEHPAPLPASASRHDTHTSLSSGLGTR